MDRAHLVKGRVEETIPARAPEAIALLRLDTDWYDIMAYRLFGARFHQALTPSSADRASRRSPRMKDAEPGDVWRTSTKQDTVFDALRIE
jgi:hypothetical protein